jgi:murein L,D-transpeptidase YcbB/YkuD
MRRYLVVFLALAVTVCLFGCGKKQSTMEEMQEPMSLSGLTSEYTLPPQATGASSDSTTSAGMVVSGQGVITSEVSKEPPLPPPGPYQPTTTQIQTALTNAGLYLGAIDGKMGPKTRKAIEEFQTANNLKVDGKVGPQTWGVLQGYLDLASEKQGKRAKKR